MPHEQSWMEAYKAWTYRKWRRTLERLSREGIAEDILTRVPWLVFDCGSQRVLVSRFGNTDRSALLCVCNHQRSIRYIAAILRHNKVETPGNWHLTEPAP